MKKYFVIGNPIDHSLSPELHNYWFKENKLMPYMIKKKLMRKIYKLQFQRLKKKK